MNKKLWEPSKTLKLNSNLLKFEKYISNRFKKKFNQNYEKIHNWTITYPHSFWSSVWDYSKVKGNKGKNNTKKFSKFYKNTFLNNSKLNFTENLLSKNNYIPPYFTNLTMMYPNYKPLVNDTNIQDNPKNSIDMINELFNYINNKRKTKTRK